ncbi:hypothetical protein GH714_015138 [Hevea brasiliensis]|uniref:Beta-glucosidase n=1 Tax=Hevea brasiliensis TaxID=3981 RepID=A0A6A6N4F7_HEVBR|nr:hypothetical protein GH714_015138 [Hevea brasiliensis]
MTFNEPWALSGFADDDGVFVPSRCLARVNPLCLAENLAIEPYIVAHHILLSHAATVQVYREKYKKNEDEKIGITLFIFWFELLSNRTIDIKASKIALDFMFGLWMEPLTNGHYPKRVQILVGDRLLTFNETEIDPEYIRYKTNSHVNVTTFDYNGYLIGPQAYSPYFYIFPKGIRSLLNYTKNRCDDPVIYITENGADNGNNETQLLRMHLRINSE